MRRDRLRFRGASGAELVGRIEAPDGPVRAHALFAHCFTCSKDLKAAGWISRALTEQGLAVMRFDFTGIGESEGDFADTDFRSNLGDLVAAAEALRRRGTPARLLIGHSLGGAAVLAAAARIPEAAAVVSLGAPAATEHLRDTLIRLAPELEAAGEAEVHLGGRSFLIRKELLDDLAEDHLSAALDRLERPLLILHSPVDEVVGIDHARRLFEAARHPKSFVSLDAADHLLTDEVDARWAGTVLAGWATRYLDTAETAAADETAPAEGHVVVRGEASGLVQAVRAGHHRLTADEPEGVGGTDQGPTPYDLLLAALGTCTSMTLRLYADRKEWPLAGIEVELSHARIHATDCEDCEDKKRKIDRIERKIRVAGDLDDEQRQRLQEIADRCPVHRTLTGELRIETELEGEG